MDGAAAPVVLASTNELAIQIVPLEILREHAVDVPEDLTALLDDDSGGDADSSDDG